MQSKNVVNGKRTLRRIKQLEEQQSIIDDKIFELGERMYQKYTADELVKIYAEIEFNVEE